MPQERFDIYFSGELIDGQDPEQAKQQVGKLFKASNSQLKRLFSGKPVAVKKDVDLDTASRYRLAFRKAGALVKIRSCPQTPASTEPALSMDETNGVDAPAEPMEREKPAEIHTGNMTLSPANSGSLEDCAPKVDTAPVPDISTMSMAAPGATVDDTPQPEPIPLETGDLSMVDGKDWTLEDCQPAALPKVMPDLDSLALAGKDDESHIPPEPPPLPMPDFNGMTLEPRQTASDDAETL